MLDTPALPHDPAALLALAAGLPDEMTALAAEATAALKARLSATGLPEAEGGGTRQPSLDSHLTSPATGPASGPPGATARDRR